MAAVVQRIDDATRPIDLVVNNAGFGTSGDFYTLDPERMGDEIALNIAALTQISRAALGVMVPRGRGYLLNVSSVVSFQPAPKLAVYAATKAYVTSLSESLHEEVRGTGVHVTALCPGLTRTEFQSVSSTRVVHDAVSVDGVDVGDRGGGGRSARCRQGQRALDAGRDQQGVGRGFGDRSAHSGADGSPAWCSATSRSNEATSQP